MNRQNEWSVENFYLIPLVSQATLNARCRSVGITISFVSISHRQMIVDYYQSGRKIIRISMKILWVVWAVHPLHKTNVLHLPCLFPKLYLCAWTTHEFFYQMLSSKINREFVEFNFAVVVGGVVSRQHHHHHHHRMYTHHNFGFCFLV